ncbi:MAG: hypothetical protein AAGG55_15090 [Pseudomonadota bacterium]
MKTLACVAVLLLLAPFALEVVLVAEVLGAEVALMFLLLYLKDQWRVVEARITGLQNSLTSTLVIVSGHAVANPRVFYVHALMSLLLFAATGSIFYPTAVWYPLATLGSNLGYG